MHGVLTGCIPWQHTAACKVVFREFTQTDQFGNCIPRLTNTTVVNSVHNELYGLLCLFPNSIPNGADIVNGTLEPVFKGCQCALECVKRPGDNRIDNGLYQVRHE